MMLFTEPANRRRRSESPASSSPAAVPSACWPAESSRLLDWRSIFLRNLPIGVLSCALSLKLAAGHAGNRERSAHRLRGAITVTGVADARQLRDRERRRPAGPPETLGLLGGAVTLVVASVILSARVAAPLRAFGVSRHRNVSAQRRRRVSWRPGSSRVLLLLALYLREVLATRRLRSASPPALDVIWGDFVPLLGQVGHALRIKKPLGLGPGSWRSGCSSSPGRRSTGTSSST